MEDIRDAIFDYNIKLFNENNITEYRYDFKKICIENEIYIDNDLYDMTKILTYNLEPKSIFINDLTDNTTRILNVPEKVLNTKWKIKKVILIHKHEYEYEKSPNRSLIINICLLKTFKELLCISRNEVINYIYYSEIILYDVETKCHFKIEEIIDISDDKKRIYYKYENLILCLHIDSLQEEFIDIIHNQYILKIIDNSEFMIMLSGIHKNISSENKELDVFKIIIKSHKNKTLFKFSIISNRKDLIYETNNFSDKFKEIMKNNFNYEKFKLNIITNPFKMEFNDIRYLFENEDYIYHLKEKNNILDILLLKKYKRKNSFYDYYYLKGEKINMFRIIDIKEIHKKYDKFYLEFLNLRKQKINDNLIDYFKIRPFYCNENLLCTINLKNWSPKNHKYFNKKAKDTIYITLLCLQRLSKTNNIFISGDIIHLLLKEIFYF